MRPQRACSMARRASILERAWVRVAVGAEGRVLPQQWLLHCTAPGIPADDRLRLNFVLYGATRRGEALCGDVTLVSPLCADGQPQPGSRDRDGAAIEVVRHRKLARLGPQRLVVLACDLSTACYKCGLCQFPRHPARCRLGRLAVTAVGGFLELRTATRPGIHAAGWHLASTGAAG